jgi:hypothetical protein
VRPLAIRKLLQVGDHSACRLFCVCHVIVFVPSEAPCSSQIASGRRSSRWTAGSYPEIFSMWFYVTLCYITLFKGGLEGVAMFARVKGQKKHATIGLIMVWICYVNE